MNKISFRSLQLLNLRKLQAQKLQSRLGYSGNAPVGDGAFADFAELGHLGSAAHEVDCN